MPEQDVQKTIKQLQKDGIRITPQRYAILEYLIQSKDHPTADEIYKALEKRFSSMSVATVYNNLRMLTDLKVIKELSYGDRASHFDFVTHEHYHAICKNCGKIVDFYYPGLEDVELAAGKLTGFQVEEHRLEVYGLCPDCQKINQNQSL